MKRDKQQGDEPGAGDGDDEHPDHQIKLSKEVMGDSERLDSNTNQEDAEVNESERGHKENTSKRLTTLKHSKEAKSAANNPGDDDELTGSFEKGHQDLNNFLSNAKGAFVRLEYQNTYGNLKHIHGILHQEVPAPTRYHGMYHAGTRENMSPILNVNEQVGTEKESIE